MSVASQIMLDTFNNRQCPACGKEATFTIFHKPTVIIIGPNAMISASLVCPHCLAVRAAQATVQELTGDTGDRLREEAASDSIVGNAEYWSGSL